VRSLRLRVLEGEYAVWKLPPEGTPPVLNPAELLSITRTATELSVVARADQAPPGFPVEAGWRCLEVDGPLAFDLTGILAAISAPLAAAGLPIFAVSTFDTDYVLVRASDLERAVAALQETGHEVTG